MYTHKVAEMSLWWISHSFKVPSLEKDALLTTRAPLPEATLPKPCGNESDFSLDGIQEVVKCGIVVPPQAVLQIGEEEKVTGGQIRTVRWVGQNTLSNSPELISDE